MESFENQNIPSPVSGNDIPQQSANPVPPVQDPAPEAPQQAQPSQPVQQPPVMPHGVYGVNPQYQQPVYRPVAYQQPAYQQSPAYQQPQYHSPQPPKPPKKKRHVFRNVILPTILILCLVLGSCCITGAIVTAGYEEQIRIQNQYLQDKVNALQKELDDKLQDVGGSGEVVAPAEGMTPAQVYKANVESVVAIRCQISGGNFGQGYAEAAGSGFIIWTEGYVVTNHHVIEGASAITVITSDEVEHSAELIGSDASNDIALLKIDPFEGIRAVNLGSSDALAVGSQVVAIGNALGEFNSSLTVGHISGKDRIVTTESSTINMLQTDVAINSGNSGGPLFNMRGEVVGITSAKYSGSSSSGASIEGIGFAIPMDDVLGMLEDLKTYGYVTGVQMGVMVRDIDPNDIAIYGLPQGVLVDSVVRGGPAEKAGIRSSDIILEVGGYEIKSMNDLTRALRNFEPEEEATVRVWRSGKEVVLTIVFAQKPQP